MSTPNSATVLYRNNSLNVLGTRLAVGDRMPDVELTAPDLSKVSLSGFGGKVRLLSVVPSLDTGICDAQTRRFNDEARKFGDSVAVITVSADLPFAQKRWQTGAEAGNVVLLSDHARMAFGDATGTHIEALRLDQRSIFVVDRRGMLRYVEYVRNFGHHPDYDAAVAAARALTTE
ncbi:MAG: thiol peroxidase [Thermoflexales bacterium]